MGLATMLERLVPIHRGHPPDIAGNAIERELATIKVACNGTVDEVFGSPMLSRADFAGELCIRAYRCRRQIRPASASCAADVLVEVSCSRNAAMPQGSNPT
jgi:hypothetical protein